jgi:hypothetical protein
MRVLAPVLACLMLGVLVPAASAATKFRPRVGGAMGLYPTVNSSGRFGAADIATGALTPVTYHGGSVMAGGVHIHTIFWAPAGFAFQGSPGAGIPTYKGLVQQFFTDSVADNGSSSNIFSVLPQFAQGTIGGPITPGAYSLSYNAADTTHDAITDTDPYPPAADQCASPNNIPTCITDAQVQAEVDHVISTTGGTRDLHNLWMVFLPPNVDECILPGLCGTNAFGGYHSLSNLGNNTAIYALVIDPLIEAVIHSGGDPQGYPDAETTIDIAAHETEEAMTDPEGIGYMDPNGFESADKCEFGPQEGTPLGFAPNGSPYNQLINGHQYLIQEMWSNNDNGCVQRTSLNGNPLPLPQVNLTQYRRVVSGNVGSAHAVSVHVAMIRAGADGSPVTVASNSTISSASDGSWSLTLQHPVGDDRDEIDIDYGGAGAPHNDVILTGNGGDPYNEAGWTGWTALDQGSDLTNGGGSSLGLGPCFQTGVLTATLNGAPILGPHGEIPTDFCSTQTDVATIPTPATGRTSVVTASTNDNRAFGPPNLPTPPNVLGALVKLTVPVGEPDAVSPFISPLPFQPSGLATCAADVELRQVACQGLVPGETYTLIDGSRRVRGAADGSGTVTASMPVRRGQSVSLSNGARTLTTLHVSNLRADIVGDQTVLSGGACQPDQYMAGPLTTPPTNASAGAASAFAGGPALTSEICPANGKAVGFGTDNLTQTDEASGGSTTTEVPAVQDTSPINAEIVYGGFTAVATSGLPGPDNSVIPTDSTSRISLAIAKASGGGVVFRAANVDTANGVKVKALKPGTYRALWTLTDANGDRRFVVTRFVEEAAQGSGPSAKPHVSCKLVNNKVKCTVTVPNAKDVSGTVRMKLVRNGQVMALGHGRISHSRATVTLRELHQVTRGSWTLTLVLGGTSTRMGVRVS